MNKENQNPVYLIRLYEWSKNAADYLRENVENPFEAIRYCYINYLLELNSEIKKVNKRWDNYCEYTYYSDLNIDNLYTIGQICDLLAQDQKDIRLIYVDLKKIKESIIKFSELVQFDYNRMKSE